MKEEQIKASIHFLILHWGCCSCCLAAKAGRNPAKQTSVHTWTHTLTPADGQSHVASRPNVLLEEAADTGTTSKQAPSSGIRFHSIQFKNTSFVPQGAILNVTGAKRFDFIHLKCKVDIYGRELHSL